MIDRDHALPITRQASLLGMSRGSVYYLPKPTSAADLEAPAGEEVAQHAAAGKRVLQVQLVDAPHQLQVGIADRLGVVVHRAAADVEQLSLALDREKVAICGPSCGGASCDPV